MHHTLNAVTPKERGFMKLGQPLQFIHTNVPGFAEHTYRMVANGFDKLKPEKPYWRSNWGLAPSGALSPFEEEIEAAAAAAAAAAILVEVEAAREVPEPNHAVTAGNNVRKEEGKKGGVIDYDGGGGGVTVSKGKQRCALVHSGFSRLAGSTDGVVYSTAGIAPKDLWLKVEHQAIHKLEQHSDCVLFTVRTYQDTLESVARDRDVGAKTCSMLAAVIRTLPPDQLKYRDLHDEDRREGLLQYLDEQARE